MWTGTRSRSQQAQRSYGSDSGTQYPLPTTQYRVICFVAEIAPRLSPAHSRFRRALAFCASRKLCAHRDAAQNRASSIEHLLILPHPNVQCHKPTLGARSSLGSVYQNYRVDFFALLSLDRIRSAYFLWRAFTSGSASTSFRACGHSFGSTSSLCKKTRS